MTKESARNDKLIDRWSLVHVGSSAVLTWLIGPIAALLVVTSWEPLEIFVISPLLARHGIVFGNETWRNSLSDVIFNGLGITAAVFILKLTV